MNLEELRKEIDAIDQRVLETLGQRFELVRMLAEIKAHAAIQVRDAGREADLLRERIETGRTYKLDSAFVTSIFHQILNHSVRVQSQESPEPAGLMRVALVGPELSLARLAAMRFFAPLSEEILFDDEATIRGAAERVENGFAEYAVVPVEESGAGSFSPADDLLLATRLHITGEEIVEQNYSLASKGARSLQGLRRIMVSQDADTRCRKFLSSLEGVSVVRPESEPGSLFAALDTDPGCAVVCHEEVALVRGLQVIARDIAEPRNAFTRYAILARTPRDMIAHVPSKTSLIFGTPDEEGALSRCLEILAKDGLNLTQLHSRPRQGVAFEYLFYADVQGSSADARLRHALTELSKATTYLKVLGSYPAAVMPATPGKGTRPAPPDVNRKKPQLHVPDSPKTRSSSGNYRIASRNHKPDDTIVQVGGVKIGGPDFVIIAGPCSVEDEEQIERCAKTVFEEGGHLLRGGCFKPRTSPYAFQGLGKDGLELLVAAGRRYGLPIVTEVVSPADVETVAELSDVIQIGARNMQNFALLNEVGRCNRPVLLKRGMMSTIDELLSAAEYVLSQGNHQVILCERGIRTFETATRNTLDISAVPVLRDLTHLPVLVDPSHAAGVAHLIPPLACASKAAGAHGMMVEIHPEPAKSVSDAKQAISLEGFAELVRRVRATVSPPYEPRTLPSP